MATKPKPNPKLNPPRPKANPARAASDATAAMQAAKSAPKGQLKSRTPATRGNDDLKMVDTVAKTVPRVYGSGRPFSETDPAAKAMIDKQKKASDRYISRKRGY